MSKLANYLNKKQDLERLKSELAALENSPEMQAELEFQKDIEALLDKHGKKASEAVLVLQQIDPSLAGKQQTGRAKRPLSRYKNPHTGEVVETRGGNHKTLKEWRKEYGKEAVQSWKQ